MTRPGLPTRGPHLFVLPFDGDAVRIDGDQGHHLATVLRVEAGDPVSLADDSGAVWQGEVAEVGTAEVRVAVGERWDVAPVTPAIRVLQGLPKGRKMDEVVQRLTEVGVHRITPVLTARTVKRPAGKADKLARRWAAIARSAAQQCRRSRLPRIDPITRWPVRGATGVVLWEEAERPLREALPGDVAELALAIGPEGGLTHAEVEESGLAPASLGPTILRTETAGVVAAAIALHVPR